MSEEFSGKGGKFVPLTMSRKWVANFQNANPGHTHCFYYDEEHINLLMSEPGCVGMRIYYGQDDNGLPKLVLVGVDAEGNNITRKEQKPAPELRLDMNSFSPDNTITGTSSLGIAGTTMAYSSVETSMEGGTGDNSGSEDDDDFGMLDNGDPCPPACPTVGFP